MKLFPRNVFPEKGNSMHLVIAECGWISILYFNEGKWYNKLPAYGCDNMSEVHPEKQFYWIKDIQDSSIDLNFERNNYLSFKS